MCLRAVRSRDFWFYSIKKICSWNKCRAICEAGALHFVQQHRNLLVELKRSEIPLDRIWFNLFCLGTKRMMKRGPKEGVRVVEFYGTPAHIVTTLPKRVFTYLYSKAQLIYKCYYLVYWWLKSSKGLPKII